MEGLVIGRAVMAIIASSDTVAGAGDAGCTAGTRVRWVGGGSQEVSGISTRDPFTHTPSIQRPILPRR